MPKFLKYGLVAVACLLGVLLIIAAIVAATFDPNDYKPQIIQLVQEKKQRTLSIPGEIKLTFFPKIGADLGRISISEQNGTAVFASMESAKVSLELIPLFSRQLVVDRIRVDGLTANLRRNKDGSSNFDDLLSKDEEAPSEQIKFDIEGVEVSRANIGFDDQMNDRKVSLADLNVSTGRIADGEASKVALSSKVKSDKPVVDAAVEIDSGFNLDLKKQRHALNKLRAKLTGKVADLSDVLIELQGDVAFAVEPLNVDLQDLKFTFSGKQAAQKLEAKIEAPKFAVTDQQVSGGKITGAMKLTGPERNVDVSFSAPSFTGTPQAFSVPALALNATIKQDKLDAKAQLTGAINGDLDKLLFSSPQIALKLDGKDGATAIKGSLSTPITADLKMQVFELSKLVAEFALPNPAGGSLALAATGSATANLSKQTLNAALKGKLDQSAIDAKFGLTKFSPPAYTFDIGVDQIDVDRYISKTARAVQKSDGQKSDGQKSAGPEKSAGTEKPIDLAALKGLNAHGTLRIGSLKVSDIKASNVRLDVRAADGKVDVSPLSANLYQGSIGGAVVLAATTPPRFSLKQQLSNVAVGPLLKDVMGKDPIEGRGDVQLDVSTQGATVTALKKALNGTARIKLRDGAVSGVNLAEIIRSARAKLAAVKGEQQTGTAAAVAKTDFSEMAASFRVNNGIAHNEDLAAKSPLLRVAGNGDINIGNDSLDYTVKATVVQTLQGQGGPELQALKGLTIPVALSGPFTAINWKVDFAGMAQGMAKQKVDEKKEELKEKAQDKLKEKFKGLFGK